MLLNPCRLFGGAILLIAGLPLFAQTKIVLDDNQGGRVIRAHPFAISADWVSLKFSGLPVLAHRIQGTTIRGGGVCADLVHEKADAFGALQFQDTRHLVVTFYRAVSP